MRKTHKKVTHMQLTDIAEEMALEHPSVGSLLGSTDQKILGVAEQVYHGEYVLPPVNSPTADRRNTWQSYI